MTSRPAEQVTQRAPACPSSSVSDNTRQGWKFSGVGCAVTSAGQKCLPAKLTLKSDPQGHTWWKGEWIPASCGTSAFSQTHRESKKKGVKGGLRVPKPGKGCGRHGGFSSSHSEHTPQKTSQARLHKHSVRLTRLHLAWVRQDVRNVHITQSSPGLVEWGQGSVHTGKG